MHHLHTARLPMQLICRMLFCFSLVAAVALSLDTAKSVAADSKEKVFRAGASAIDVTPQEFPVIVNGGFREAQADSVTDPLFVRCLVKPGTAHTNPFSGLQNDGAQMNPGYQNPNMIRRTGPADPDVSIAVLRLLNKVAQRRRQEAVIASP